MNFLHTRQESIPRSCRQPTEWPAIRPIDWLTDWLTGQWPHKPNWLSFVVNGLTWPTIKASQPTKRYKIPLSELWKAFHDRRLASFEQNFAKLSERVSHLFEWLRCEASAIGQERIRIDPCKSLEQIDDSPSRQYLGGANPLKTCDRWVKPLCSFGKQQLACRNDLDARPTLLLLKVTPDMWSSQRRPTFYQYFWELLTYLANLHEKPNWVCKVARISQMALSTCNSH